MGFSDFVCFRKPYFTRKALLFSLSLAKVLQKPDAILLAEIFEKNARLGMIHPVFQPVSTA